MGENQALNKKLQKIGSMSATGPPSSSVVSSGTSIEQKAATSQPMVSKTTKLKQDRRRRENERISRENLKMLKRLNSVKPEYSVKNFRKQVRTGRRKDAEAVCPRVRMH
jgi:hypothetical protein